MVGTIKLKVQRFELPKVDHYITPLYHHRPSTTTTPIKPPPWRSKDPQRSRST